MKTSRPKRSKKQTARPLFEAIRKPVAPPGHPLTRAKPEERVHPAQRKAKHKQRDVAGDEG